jgi:hypothetical protein
MNLGLSKMYLTHDADFIINNQQAVIYYLLQDHSTCFRCSLHPSSGVHKTVDITTGMSHVSV